METQLKKTAIIDRTKFSYRLKSDLKRHKYIYIMAVPVVLYYFLFCYYPMYGIIIAFKNFAPTLGILGSPWVGLKWFEEFFSSFYIGRLLSNTFLISIYDMLFGFPSSIILALMLNEVHNKFFKRSIQTFTYIPYFISLVVLCGILVDFTSTQGLFNDILAFFGMNRANMLAEPSMFKSIFVGSGIWQNIGWGSIIYLAALSGISPSLYEAAVIDGAGRWKQLWHITIPGIIPTIIILLILRIGSIMGVGYEKIILLYNPLTYETADVISSYVYRKGLIENNYSYSTAIGSFNSVINFIFLYVANKLSAKFSETSLW